MEPTNIHGEVREREREWWLSFTIPSEYMERTTGLSYWREWSSVRSASVKCI